MLTNLPLLPKNWAAASVNWLARSMAVNEQLLSALSDEFLELEHSLERVLGLLEEAGETFWSRYLSRGRAPVAARKLSGATYVLGCYGGENTLSDLVVGQAWETSDPQKYRNLNARLGELRTALFEAANQITSRRSW